MKYEFTEETKFLNGFKLRRIKALKSFKDVNIGDLGGFIENESNLSHTGNAWVKDDAAVYGNGRVIHNGLIQDTVEVYESARVQGDHILFGGTKLLDYAVAY